MIYLNQIRNTRYLIQTILNDDLHYELKITIMFEYFNFSKKFVPFNLGIGTFHSLIINGKKINNINKYHQKAGLPTKELNNLSENIIFINFSGKLKNYNFNKDINNNSINTENSMSENIIIDNHRLLSFDSYTSSKRYRLVVTFPENWRLINKIDPFDSTFYGKKKIMCFESDTADAPEKLKLIAAPKNLFLTKTY